MKLSKTTYIRLSLAGLFLITLFVGKNLGFDQPTINNPILIILLVSGVSLIIITYITTQTEKLPRIKNGQVFLKRKSFPNSVKESVLRKQNHRCSTCHRILTIVDFDHIDDDRSNNNYSNCQALCPNCHAEKSRRTQMGIN